MKLRQDLFSLHKPLLVILLLVISFSGTTTAQNHQGNTQDYLDLYAYVLKKYGFDHDLLTGIQFYNNYHHVLYHPYLFGEESLPGAVTISGKPYDNLMINYDIFNQWVVLEYKEMTGGINKIILEPLHTDAFQLDGNEFEKLALDDRGPLFYQVIRAGGLTCYIHWDKKLLQTFDNLEYAESFTNASRTFYLEYNGTISAFSNRKDFVSLFPGNARKDIRKFMRKNFIRFLKVSIKELTGLLEYVSTNHL